VGLFFIAVEVGLVSTVVEEDSFDDFVSNVLFFPSHLMPGYGYGQRLSA
jgi:hypothetical protein